jgi:hypothetical protein
MLNEVMIKDLARARIEDLHQTAERRTLTRLLLRPGVRWAPPDHLFPKPRRS